MDMLFTHDIVSPPPPPAQKRGVGVGLSGASQKHRWCVRELSHSREIRGSHRRTHTIGQKVQRRHVLVVLKGIQCFLLFIFAFRVPYIYACFL